MLPTDFGINTAENAKCLKGKFCLHPLMHIAGHIQPSTSLLVFQQTIHQVFLCISEKFNSHFKNNFYRSK